jgi:D-amino-acid dehydrogenase
MEKIFLATGHGPTGLLLGPYSGKIVADMMLGGQVTTDISAFRISRFSE